MRREAEAGPVLPGQGFPADDPCWDVAWLADLRAVPDACRWPRFMSAPHPDAVDTLGPQVTASAARYGVEMRWWQRLALARLLEVDGDGALCWQEALLTCPRRAGKSWLLRELAWWRMMDGRRLFGEPQLILHTARTLETTLDIVRPAFERARELWQQGITFQRGSGREVIVSPDGSRWTPKAEGAAYGLGASLAICDEAWDYKPEVVTEGIQPTMMERLSPQLLIVSTAHRRATKLLPERRAAALAELAEPRRRLLIEWSAPVGEDLLASAREASPVWDAARARHVTDAIDDARTAIPVFGQVEPLDMWASQYVNDWGASKLLGRRQGEPLIDLEDWEGVGVAAAGPIAVCAVEDYFGRSFGVGWARTDPDTLDVVVGGQIVGDRASLRHLLEELAVGEVLAGASITNDAMFEGLGAQPVGGRETRPALAEMRRGVAEGRVFHDGSADLTAQMADVRVAGRDGGLAVLAGHRSDVLRAAAWCVAHIEAGRRVAPAVF